MGALDDILIKEKSLVSRRIAGETLVVPIKGRLADMQRVFAMSSLAEFIWERLDGNTSLGEIRDQMLETYEVTRQEAEADIDAFAEDLCRAGLAARRAADAREEGA